MQFKKKDEYETESEGVKELGEEKTVYRLWQMTYKRGSASFQHGVIEATSEKVAIYLARKWCTQNKSRYISIGAYVLASERDEPVDMEKAS